MKKVIALFFAIIYLVFTTSAMWQVSETADQFGHDWYERCDHVYVASDSDIETSINNNVLAVKSISKALKHLNGKGKRNLSRTISINQFYRNVVSFSNSGFHQTQLSTATPLLYQPQIYLKNGVLRI